MGVGDGQSIAPTPSAADGTLTVDQALELATVVHRSGDTLAAERLYRRILEQVPDHPETIHYLGVLHHATGRSDAAIALIRQAITLRPDDVNMHNNLGNVLTEVGRPTEAVDAYIAAVALDPEHVDALNNLGVALRLLKRPGDAETVYRRVIAIDPLHREAHDNLGRLLASRGQLDEALACHRRALDLEPRNATTRRLLVHTYAIRGERDKAVAIVDEWLAEEPGSVMAQHLRASVSGQDVPARASDRYVEKVFDSFAATFDRKLASLEYRAPELVTVALRAACGEGGRNLDILDAGCGTGLCGPLVSAHARRLDGVDLSKRMLDRASERGVYDTLTQGELTGFLLDHRGAYDVVLSADTLCYFGDLAAFLDAARNALRPGGLLIFTLEEEFGEQPFVLNLHGRYSHRLDYVSAALAAAGLVSVVLEQDILRLERGQPVQGLAVSARTEIS